MTFKVKLMTSSISDTKHYVKSRWYTLRTLKSILNNERPFNIILSVLYVLFMSYQYGQLSEVESDTRQYAYI